MTQKLPLSRPAMSAIAAFLALSTPAAFAQEAPTVPMTPPVVAPPTVASPPTVTQPSTTTPVAVPQAAQPPAPKPVIRVPLDLPAVPEKPAPKAAERAAAPAPQRAERAAPRPRTVERAATATAAATPEPAAPAAADPATLASEAVPVAAPVTTPAEPVAAAPVAPAETATTGNGFPWELAGGAAALLIVGGAGLAFARRRRTAQAEDAYEGMSYEAMKAAEAVPYSLPREEVAPPQPAMRSTPSFAAAPTGSMGRHEAMALAGPTEDNPFATLKKRLARARFLDSQERAAYDETLAAQQDTSRKPVSAWEIAQLPVPAETQRQEVRRPEPARVRTNFRPGFSNN